MEPGHKETAEEGGPKLRKVRTNRCDVCLHKRNVLRIDKEIRRPGYYGYKDKLRIHICVACLLHGALLLIDLNRKGK